MKKVSAVTLSVRPFLAKLCLISAFSPPRSQNLLDFVNDMAVKYSLYPESPEFYFAVTDYKLVVLYKQKTGTFCCVRYNRHFATTGFVICGVYCKSFHILFLLRSQFRPIPPILPEDTLYHLEAAFSQPPYGLNLIIYKICIFSDISWHNSTKYVSRFTWEDYFCFIHFALEYTQGII